MIIIIDKYHVDCGFREDAMLIDEGRDTGHDGVAGGRCIIEWELVDKEADT
jgi:hypothetical protein